MIDRLQASWSLLGLQRMATALFATLDPATGQLRIASAGHLPPLLLADGHAEFLPVPPSRMLGAPPAPAPALEWAGVLPVGATLVLFTDGLVESRSADIDEGLAHLLAGRGGGGHVGPRRALRPAAGRPDRRAPRRRHRPAGADPDLTQAGALTGAARLTTLDVSEGAGMGEIDDRTVDGLKATLVRAFEHGDAALAASLYEPGARLLPPGAPVITGADAVRAFFQRRFDAGSDGGELETVRLDEYGDVAVEEGRYGAPRGGAAARHRQVPGGLPAAARRGLALGDRHVELRRGMKSWPMG